MVNESIADLLTPGDPVFVDAVDGFGGPAAVVEVRDHPYARCKVRMEDGSQPPFWAHDFELSPRPPGPSGPGYDSRPDTVAHVGEVRRLLARCVRDLAKRAAEHDRSKLADPEKATFDEYTPKLKGSTYGSDEYRAFLAAMRPALEHHYSHNTHHPEHYPDGVRGMCLLDLVEMLCDWKAASLRHADGSLRRSIELNQKRFGYSDELKAVLTNTAERLGLFVRTDHTTVTEAETMSEHGHAPAPAGHHDDTFPHEDALALVAWLRGGGDHWRALTAALHLAR